MEPPLEWLLTGAVIGEPFTQYSPLHGAYTCYHLTTAAGNRLGDIYRVRHGWCLDRSIFGEPFLDPRAYATPEKAARAALQQALARHITA